MRSSSPSARRSASASYIPAGTASHMLDAVSLLRSMEGEEPPRLGRRVVVYGGGNTALDAARTAKRLGAEEAMIVYRRTRERMPAHEFELRRRSRRASSSSWLTTIKRADPGSLIVERMELDRPASRRPASSRTLEADYVVLALGQNTDLSFRRWPGSRCRPRRRGRLADDDRRAGDLRRGRHGAGQRTITVAVGHGKKAARNIDAWLRGEP